MAKTSERRVAESFRVQRGLAKLFSESTESLPQNLIHERNLGIYKQRWQHFKEENTTLCQT